MDEDIPAYSTDHTLEEQLKSVQKSLKELTSKVTSGALIARQSDIPHTPVDRKSTERTFYLCRLNFFVTFAKSMETT